MKRKIQDLRDLNTGEELKADKWISALDEAGIFNLRRKLKEDYIKNKSPIVCATCNQPVYLAGLEHYFKHWKELGDCPIKTKGKYSQKQIDRMKYNGVQESLLHIELKEYLYELLNNDGKCSGVEKEKVIKSIDVERWWKKPDISLEFNGIKMVIEIQLSTTHLNVIVDRDTFYKENNIFILWVFNDKDENAFRFTEKDIFFNNHRNAFLMDEESVRVSEKENKLFLTCYFQKPSLENGKVIDKWEKQLISFNEIKFDANKYKIYFYDYEEALNELQKSIDLDLAQQFEKYWIIRSQLSRADRDKKDAFYIEKLRQRQIQIDKMDRALSGVLNALYSAKLGQITGYQFPNFIGLSNLILERRKEFARIYMWALETYGMKEAVQEADTKKSFAKKIAVYKKERPPQSDEFNELFRFLFPELSEIIKADL